VEAKELPSEASQQLFRWGSHLYFFINMTGDAT
jgi:hypothetical protein